MRKDLRTTFVLSGVVTKGTAECGRDCFLPGALASQLIFKRHLRGGGWLVIPQSQHISPSSREGSWKRGDV